MSRHRILIQTDPTWLKTGLAGSARNLLKHLWKTGKYEIAQLATQGTPVNHPLLASTPWKTFGCIPSDQNLINELNRDPHRARNAAYGAYGIDAVIKEWKPTIWTMHDDAWSAPKADYIDKPWFNKINSILHITVDSLPVTEMAYEQARHCKHFLAWAKFAQKEMRSKGPEYAHVGQIYGSSDTNAFAPISPQEKADMRRRFGIDQDALIFLVVNRNQPRKSFGVTIKAFARFRKDFPHVKAKLHFHTSFSEKANGWDIPKLMTDNDVDVKDVLCTYVCKACGQWHVAPYSGEDINCPFCGAEKSNVTANIGMGIPDEEMKYLYGLADAGVSAFTSGGQEYGNNQTLLCGLPLACTNYSCGEDFCEQPFVTPLSWHIYHEERSNFIKAATDESSITSFMRRVHKMSPRDRAFLGEQGRAWAVDTFGIAAIGAQWEKLFDTMPVPDWSSITLTHVPKNEALPMPEGLDDEAFVTTLYKEVLAMDEPVTGEGARHWAARLKAGVTRADVHRFFIQTAQEENKKNGVGQQAVKFRSLLTENGRKRVLFVIPRSIGDVFIVTALFESIHKQHPDSDLYVATEPQYHSLLADNPYVFRVLPYLPAMENELMMCGQGTSHYYFDAYYNPAITTQQHLAYLNSPEPAFSLQ